MKIHPKTGSHASNSYFVPRSLATSPIDPCKEAMAIGHISQAIWHTTTTNSHGQPKKLINVWGADHVGYIPRITSALAALSDSKANLRIVVCQLVRVLRDGREVRMSKREGSFVTLGSVGGRSRPRRFALHAFDPQAKVLRWTLICQWWLSRV